MALVLNGSANTLGGLAVGGLPDGSVAAADLADGAVTSGKLASGLSRKILGMNQVTYTSQQRSISSGGGMTDSGIEIAYTPVASNSTAILTFNSYQKAPSGNYVFLAIRQADAMFPSGSSNDYVVNASGDSAAWTPVSFSVQISPSWTAGTQTTFQIYWRPWTTATTIYLGWGTSLGSTDKMEHFRIEEIAA
tara:strand:- start:93 stop:668 length:576 start_codon:yes stop_codon:yes gene_type:complete